VLGLLGVVWADIADTTRRLVDVLLNFALKEALVDRILA
jgi:hypothetical protein